MGTDKALLEIHNKRLLQHAIDFCSPFCSRLLISSNHKEHDKFGPDRIPDDIINCGPLGGIYSCLKKSETDWNFVLSVDAVFVEPELIQEMIQVMDNFSAVVSFHSKGKEPLVAFYNKKAIDIIEKQIEKKNYRITDLLELLETKWVDAQEWVDKNPRIFHNINRPEDFTGLQ